MDEITATTAAQADPSPVPVVPEAIDLKAERARVSGLLKVSGISIPAEVLTAIEIGTDVGAFAIAKADADAATRAAADKTAAAEIAAAKALRENAGAQNLGAVKSGNLPDAESDEGAKIDALVASTLPKKKGV